MSTKFPPEYFKLSDENLNLGQALWDNGIARLQSAREMLMTRRGVGLFIGPSLGSFANDFPLEHAIAGGAIVVEHIVEGGEFTEGIDTHGVDVSESHDEFCRQVSVELAELIERKVVYIQALEPDMNHAEHVIFDGGQVVCVGTQNDGLHEQWLQNIPIAIARVEAKNNYWHTWEEGGDL